MHLDKFVKSPTGKYLMSILLGFGFASMFRQACKGRNCKLIQAPPLEEIDDKIFKIENKCYKIEKQVINCKSKKQTLHFP
jgi:hypothetical protein